MLIVSPREKTRKTARKRAKTRFPYFSRLNISDQTLQITTGNDSTDAPWAEKYEYAREIEK